MNLTRTSLVAACLAVGMTIAVSPSFAGSKGNPASQGYPNGRPWQAMKFDFMTVKHMLDNINDKLRRLNYKVDGLHDDIGALQDKMDMVAADVASLTNTLDIQVSVVPNADRNADNDAPVTVLVHVTQQGHGVTGLTADNFSYSSSFPMAGATYCGASCFTAGTNGVYAIVLNGNWSASSYAGALDVSSTVATLNGNVTSYGSSLVAFDIPAAPAP